MATFSKLFNQLYGQHLMRTFNNHPAS